MKGCLSNVQRWLEAVGTGTNSVGAGTGPEMSAAVLPITIPLRIRIHYYGASRILIIDSVRWMV